jgi:tRNA 2-thiouridine synthesizing protein C
MARVLVVFSQPPHGGTRAREGLDLALAAIAFDHEVSVYFCGEGIGLLRSGQDTRGALLKDWCRAFRALPVHGLHRAGAASVDLNAQDVSPGALLLDVQSLVADEAARWLAEADVVFSC